ncbi:MAG: hypothetical protein ACJAU5_001061, partial [Maricaulis maris]
MFARLKHSTALVALMAGAGLAAPALAQQAEVDGDVIVVTSAPLGVTADEIVGAVEVVDR